MRIEKKVEKAIQQRSSNKNVERFDKVYKNSLEIKGSSNLPNLENRHKSEDLRNLKFITNK